MIQTTLKCCLESNYDPEFDLPPACDNPNLSQWHEMKSPFYYHDLNEAAEKYAEYLCSQDPDYYETFLNDDNVVLVKGSDDVIRKMVVSAEQTVKFSATEVK